MITWLALVLVVVVAIEFVLAYRADAWPEQAFYLVAGVLTFGTAVWSLGQP